MTNKAGNASMWQNGGARPSYTIKATAHKDMRAGEEFEIAFWSNAFKAQDRMDRKEGWERKPDYLGTVKDPYNQRQQETMSRDDYMRQQQDRAATTTEKPPFDDEIPF